MAVQKNINMLYKKFILYIINTAVLHIFEPHLSPASFNNKINKKSIFSTIPVFLNF